MAVAFPVSRRPFAPPARRPGAAFVVVAMSYVYFLIFAQFGFLRELDETLRSGHGLTRPVMGTMALAGIAGSLAAARFFGGARSRMGLKLGFAISGLAAGQAGVAVRPGAFFAAAALIGLGVGLVTVALASRLRHEFRLARLGRMVGLATGSAYAFCNLPGIFTRGPYQVALIALAAAVIGWIASGFLAAATDEKRDAGREFGPQGAVRWIGVFFLLVGLDSAVFAVVQRESALKAATWLEPGQLWLNAGVHLAAAYAAGLALDRWGMVRTVGLGAAGLIGATALLASGVANGGVAALYVAAVSIYSTALVYYPARSGRAPLAAAVYIVAGWVGSGLGVAGAEQMQDVPAWLPIAVGAALAALLALRLRR
jgi:hypothetical protein